MPEVHEVVVTLFDDIVRSFYESINAKDPTALGTLIDDYFTEAAAVEFPPSLPYGGRVEGARRLRKLFTSMASQPAPFGPRVIDVQDVVVTPDRVIAVLAFDWFAAGSSEPVSSGACEVWTLRDGKVVEIRAFYWDTAALVASV